MLDGFRWELCLATRTPLLVRASSPSYVLDEGCVVKITTLGTPPRRTARQLDCSPLTQPELFGSPPTERSRRLSALGLMSTLEGVAAMDDATSMLATLTPGEVGRTTAAMRVLLDMCHNIDSCETAIERSQSPCPSPLPDWLVVAEKLLRVQGEAGAVA